MVIQNYFAITLLLYCVINIIDIWYDYNLAKIYNSHTNHHEIQNSIVNIELSESWYSTCYIANCYENYQPLHTWFKNVITKLPFWLIQNLKCLKLISHFSLFLADFSMYIDLTKLPSIFHTVSSSQVYYSINKFFSLYITVFDIYIYRLVNCTYFFMFFFH